MNGGSLAQPKKKIWQSWLFPSSAGATGVVAAMTPAVLGEICYSHPRR